MQPWEQPGSGLTRRGPHGTRDTGWGSKGWKVPDFRRLYLLWGQVSGFSSVGPDVSLQQTGSVEGLPTDVAGQHGLLLGSPAGAGPGWGLLGGEVE